tara:strand:+ start:85434 stop:85631 length:198 start_codon:yes stop_codon:yes gene_type:complete
MPAFFDKQIISKFREISLHEICAARTADFRSGILKAFMDISGQDREMRSLLLTLLKRKQKKPAGP